MIWFIIWAIGAIIAIGLLFAECVESNLVRKEGKDQTGMVLIGTVLSWITVFVFMYKTHKELKEEENNFKTH